MDAYDAILEQMQRAQKRALEAMTNRLNFVAERLEDSLREARSAVDEAVPADAEELFPISELSAAVAGLRNEAVPAAPAAISKNLLDAAARLEGTDSQSSLLRELLSTLTAHAARAAVLVARGESVMAWSGIGFSDPEKLRSWQAELSASSALSQLSGEMNPVRFSPLDDPVFSQWLQGEDPCQEALLVPVVLRGKLMGGIYTDWIEGKPWDPEAVQLLGAVACWLIDTLQARQSGGALLIEPVDLRSAKVEPEPVAEPEPIAQPPVENEFELQEEPAVSEPPEPEPVEAEVQAEVEPPQEIPGAPGGGFDPSATMRVETAAPGGEFQPVTEAEPEQPAEMVEEPVEEIPAEAEAPAEPPPVSEVVPPEDPPPVSAVVPPDPVDDAAPGAEGSIDAQVEEARRFARLLVSEIKLYNDDEVDRGRVNGDIYNRLKEDIDRSREMYEKRIPAEVRQGRDLFREELVRILADGDENALGM